MVNQNSETTRHTEGSFTERLWMGGSSSLPPGNSPGNTGTVDGSFALWRGVNQDFAVQDRPWDRTVIDNVTKIIQRKTQELSAYGIHVAESPARLLFIPG